MADNKSNKQIGPEISTHTPQAPEKRKQREAKEVKEATISVGIEAGGIIEDAEQGSGDISESEKKSKDGYTGSGGTTGTATAGVKKINLPPVGKMTNQVEKQLKKEMKFLNKKIKNIVKERDANSLNSLVARLRELRRLLSKLANATADMIKDMWISYVKEKKN